MVRAPSSPRTGADMAHGGVMGWALMKPILASRMLASIRSGAMPMLTPSSVSTSLAPDSEEAARLPCLATGTPQAATISAASVEIL